ncbi:MAG: polyprenyl synthetase family protein [Actinomycetota bacterium]|nr:polyprenyl synthetase family protein [Actinomycetota bacterium]
MPSEALRTLAAQLRDEDTVVSPHVVNPVAPAALGELVASGQAASRDPAAYALVIESVREGYLLHYGEPRVIVGADADLRLLAGDYLYALGLERLAGLGDLPAVRELSDLISLTAQLNAEGGEGPPARAGEALWLASTLAIASGNPSGLEEAKFALRRGNPGALEAVEAAAVSMASTAALADALADASHAIQSASSN